MASHTYNYPKVQPVKVTSAHRKTELHPVVPRDDDAAKQPRERARPKD